MEWKNECLNGYKDNSNDNDSNNDKDKDKDTKEEKTVRYRRLAVVIAPFLVLLMVA
jgi:hypothetical protein